MNFTPERNMTKTATEYKATFTNGESRIFLGWSAANAREMAYSWLCAYRPGNVHIRAVEAA